MMLEAESMRQTKPAAKGSAKIKTAAKHGGSAKKAFHRSGDKVAPKKPSAGPHPKTGQPPLPSRSQPKATSKIATKPIL